MRELSLFTGAGGGLLCTRLMNWRCVGAVEIDKFCCERVEQRMKEGHLGEQFPIWNMDIRDFNRRVAPRYTGMVDVVSAGFPCQPFSVAGKQLAEDDERNMWPATIECIRIIEPESVWLENVPGLLTGSHGYFGRILGELAESGYDARWRVLSAAELGAPHKRDRLWVLADTKGLGQHQSHNGCKLSQGTTTLGTSETISSGGFAINTTASPGSHTVPDSNDTGRAQRRGAVSDEAELDPLECGSTVPNPNSRGCAARSDGTRRQAGANPTGGGDGSGLGCRPGPDLAAPILQDDRAGDADGDRWDASTYWAVEPDVGRVAHGVADRVDRLKALGNGQVPAVARAAWELLTQ